MLNRPLANRVLRVLAAILLLAFGITILSVSIADSDNSAQKDFIAYWAAGQLLAHHSNPYDADSVFQLEKSAGYTETQPLVMRNPPYVLVLALPLGLLSPARGVIVWSLLIVASLMASVRLLWILSGRPGDRTHLLIYVFAPALACVKSGQTSTFALLGMCLFLYLYRDRPLAAGMSLPLLLIKPHLLLPLCAVLLIWIVSRKAYRIVAGAAVATLLALAIAMFFKGGLLWDYLPVLNAANRDSAVIPTVSLLLRLSLFQGAQWAQVVPALLACLWSVWYFVRRRNEWTWEIHGAPLLLVSLWLAPYSWFTDEILLAPAILRAIYLAADQRWPIVVFAFLDSLALGLVVAGVSLLSGAYVWTTSAWLIWFWYATRSQKTPAEVSLSSSCWK